MQTRSYPEDDGQRVWLSRPEQEALLSVYRDEEPRRELALELGLHGLRSDEIVTVAPQHFRRLDGGADAERYNLRIPTAKRGPRECPVSADVRQRATLIANTAGVNQSESLIDVTTKTLREWIRDARNTVAANSGSDGWQNVGMHDLRRTWATDTYYSLAFAGIPIAEQLTMSWGGWKMTESGRSTFREQYLGPVPDHVTHEAAEHLRL